MIGVKITGGGFDKVVFESEIDTLAGGAMLDASGETYTDGIIPAGTLVSVKDVNGIVYPVKITDPGDSATFDREPLGFVHMSVEQGENTPIGVVIAGVVRKDALEDDVKASVKAIRTKVPTLTFV